MKIPRELHHNECIAQLPEYLGGTLHGDAAAAVAAHLESCARCRDHLRLGHSLRRHFNRQHRALAALITAEREQDNFARLWDRIEADRTRQDQPPRPSPPIAVQRRHRTGCSPTRRPWRSLASIASCALAVLLVMHAKPPSPHFSAPPRSASSPAHNACEKLQVHFIDNLRGVDLQQLLGAVDAQVIEGPSRRGDYTLLAQAPNKTLYQLQLHPAVVRAEAVGC